MLDSVLQLANIYYFENLN